MNIDDILQKMQPETTQTKTASANKPAATPGGALATAINKVASAPVAPAPASHESDAAEDLLKIASELAGAEKEAEAAQAYLCGQAFADGAIAKFAAYDAGVKVASAKEATEVLQQERDKLAGATAEFAPVDPAENIDALVKQASEAGYADANVIIAQNSEKVAEGVETDAQVKQATAAGYTDAKARTLQPNEKQAEDAGYNAGIQQVHDTAVNEFLKGAAVAEVMVQKYQQQSQQQSQPQ